MTVPLLLARRGTMTRYVPASFLRIETAFSVASVQPPFVSNKRSTPAITKKFDQISVVVLVNLRDGVAIGEIGNEITTGLLFDITNEQLP